MIYTTMIEKMMSLIPDNILVYSLEPLDVKSFNRYYLMMIKYLHPDSNIVCIKNENKYVPLPSDDTLQMFLGGITFVTYNKFIKDCLDIGLMMVMKGRNGQKFFLVNPAFARNINVNIEVVTSIFNSTRNTVGLEIDKLPNGNEDKVEENVN